VAGAAVGVAGRGGCRLRGLLTVRAIGARLYLRERAHAFWIETPRNAYIRRTRASRASCRDPTGRLEATAWLR